jgi:8-oxo-dGTP pyrophosphatase MutT (NUDIX family)
MNREISAGIIIFRRTKQGLRFLLLYQGGWYWNFPKGKLIQGEQSFRAALREVYEETGLAASELRCKGWFKMQDSFTYVRNKEKIFKTVTYYLAVKKSVSIRLKVKPDNEEGERHEGYGWFLYRDASRFVSTPNIRRHLKKAYDFITQRKRRTTVFRSHPV